MSLSFQTQALGNTTATPDTKLTSREITLFLSESLNAAYETNEANTDVVEADERAFDTSFTPIVGKNTFNFVGSAADIPRDWILGVSLSNFYCDGNCETFYEFTVARGQRTKEVRLKTSGGRLRVGFFYNPLNSECLILGIGPDLSLRYDRVHNQYQSVVSTDDIYSAELGLGVRLRLRLNEATDNRDRDLKKYFVVSYRAFAQTVLRNCKKVSNTDAPFEGCRNAKALQTYEDYLVHGGGYEVYFGFEFRF